MEQLCDEVLQLIFYELQDPSSFILISKRFYEFSQDPYLRAHYFLSRYGPVEAMFHALGRGRVLSERTLDILISSGAHFSRYLIQVAMHHYFHTQTHFIKTQWVKSVPLPVFLHFMKIASNRYEDIPRGKGQDDGSIFAMFLNESRYPSSQKRVSWETIRDIIEKYHFFPFSVKDPIMAHFPLALAIEPRLLPYAVANGFYMDRKYRDFVFRKMFENASASDRKAEDIVQNVIELCRLDSTMFLSRTVAAEVCVEARANEVGFSALKRLNAGGHLLFDLPTLVADLLKLFLKTRSVITTNMQNVIRYLYSEFPSSDPSVRLVVLLTIFFPADSWNVPVATIKARLEELDFGPVTRQDLYNLLMHPFTDRCESVLSYMLKEMESDHGKTGLSEKEIEQVANDVALRLIEVDCKGKMLRKLRESYPSVHKTISRATLDNHQINLDDLPQPDDVEQCSRFRTKLCRDNHFGPTDFIYLWDGNTTAQESSSRQCGNNESEVENKSHTGSDGDGAETRELGEIGQESLTAMIRNDELSSPVRNRRRISYFSSYTDLFSHLPLDFVQVGRWVKGEYGSKNRVTAIFMTHAILNDNLSTLRDLLMESHSSPVPITFKHFQMLARLGRSINYHIVAYLLGCPEFYFTEEEYISQYSPTKRTDGSNGKKVKSHSSITLPQVSVLIEQTPTFSKGRKRPRRSAANTVQSYAIPDDDEDEMNIVQAVEDVKPLDVKQRKEAANLQTWIKHLGDLLKTEQARLRQRKRQWEEQNPGTSVSDKNLFVKSLSAHLRLLRKHNREKYGHLPKETEFTPEEYDDDGEYIYRATRSAKKART